MDEVLERLLSGRQLVYQLSVHQLLVHPLLVHQLSVHPLLVHQLLVRQLLVRQLARLLSVHKTWAHAALDNLRH